METKEKDTAKSQALAQYASIVEMVERLKDSETEEEAQQEIAEDPLSVEIRSDWVTDPTEMEPSEFCILLCTGGPAVRIMGELDEHKQPHRAWIEYQDWGTPWTHCYIEDSTEALLTYCGQFYYGDY